jgi:DNA-directed RNA polymerase specialized sigma24 family protein
MTDMRPNGISYKKHLKICKMKRRKALLFYDKLNYSYSNIARIFGCSKSYAMEMIYKAKLERSGLWVPRKI